MSNKCTLLQFNFACFVEIISLFKKWNRKFCDPFLKITVFNRNKWYWGWDPQTSWANKKVLRNGLVHCWLWFNCRIVDNNKKTFYHQHYSAIPPYLPSIFLHVPFIPFFLHFPFLFCLLLFPLSCQAWRPKTLLQHLKLRSKSGQMWRLALAQVSVQHPHTPQSRFAHFRCSAGAEGGWGSHPWHHSHFSQLTA